MDWSIENEDICASIALECQILYMAHTEAYRNYKSYSLFFLFPTICISAVSGGLSFSESFNSSETNKLILGGFSIFLAILNSLFKILNINDLETQHFYLSKMWYMLYEQIRLELARSPDERVKCLDFIKDINDIKKQLLEKNIILNPSIIKKYKNKYKKSGFDLPLALNHLSPIIIYRRGNRTPLTPLSRSIIVEEEI